MTKPILRLCAEDGTGANVMLAMMPELARRFRLEFQARPGSRADQLFRACGVPMELGLQYHALFVDCPTQNGDLVDELLVEAHSVFGAPSIGICDTYGAHERHHARRARSYITPNSWAAGPLDGWHNQICGDINLQVLPRAPDTFRDEIRTWVGADHAIVWAAQIDVEQLEILCALRRHGHHFKLLCGMHPDKGKWPMSPLDLHEKVLATFGNDWRASFNWPDIGTDHLVEALDPGQTIVAGAYSGALLKAAFNGYRVMLLDGSHVREAYMQECPPGTQKLPLAEMIGSPVVELLNVRASQHPFELSYPELSVVKRELLPFDPQCAAEYVWNEFVTAG